MKIRPVGSEFSMLKDIRRDTTKLIVAFRNYAKASKKFAIGYVSNKNMFQFETCKKYLTDATWLKHVDFTIMHTDIQLAKLLNHNVCYKYPIKKHTRPISSSGLCWNVLYFISPTNFKNFRV